MPPVYAPPPVPHVAPVAAQPSRPRETLVRTVLARPLFTPARRPPAGPAVPGGFTPMPRLAGTVMAGGQRLAILVAAQDTKPFVVREGVRSHGLVVLAIEPTRILAETAAGRVSIPLAADGSRPASAPAPLLVSSPEMTKDPRLRGANNQDE